MAYQEIDIKTIYNRQLYKSLCIPSSAHMYSLCIQYMRDWMLSKFQKDYFKSVYVEGSHVLNDFRSMNDVTILKRLKPSLAIIPQVDFSFDRDKIDFYPFGIENYTIRSNYNDAFFKDKDRHLYLGIGMDASLINFTFKVRLASRAQQLDMYKYMKMACRVGATQGEYVDMDFHIPSNIINQLARDVGYRIVDDKIEDVIKFIKYFNSHSSITLLYKYRYVNGKSEFFLRLRELYVHVNNTGDLSVDDGEREGQLSNNFTIEMSAAVRFPAPQFYVYYSENKQLDIQPKSDAIDFIPVFTAKIVDVPEINEKKWDQYLTTEYMSDNTDEILIVDFKELFGSSDLGRVIDYNNNIFISSNIFMDIKIYNEGKTIEYYMDWNTMTLTTKNSIKDNLSFISIYCDLNYMNEVIANLDGLENDRLRNKK